MQKINKTLSLVYIIFVKVKTCKITVLFSKVRNLVSNFYAKTSVVHAGLHTMDFFVNSCS